MYVDGVLYFKQKTAYVWRISEWSSDVCSSDLVATKIFLPNPFGQSRDYIEGFSLSEAEFKLVREELSPESRKFIVKQGHDYVVVGLDPIGMDDELAVLLGRAETTGVDRKVIAELGNEPTIRLTEFDRRRRPS